MIIINFRGKYPLIRGFLFLLLNVLIIFRALVLLLINGYLIDELLLLCPFIFISELFLACVETLLVGRKKKQD